MKIEAIYLLPPLAIGRLGSAKKPLANYSLVDPPMALGFRLIKPEPTLDVGDDGVVTVRTPSEVTFKDQQKKVRPVAPFLEVWALTDQRPDELAPLDLALLAENELTHQNISWSACVANLKVFRRTNDKNDKVVADVPWFSNHVRHDLLGRCQNFVDGKHICFGHLQYLMPNESPPECKQIRLRFTPAGGLIYGPLADPGEEADPVIPDDRKIYDRGRGRWGRRNPEDQKGWPWESQNDFINETLPPSLFASVPPAPPWLHEDIAISRGYLDDACDGFVYVRLTFRDGRHLDAKARIVSGPPCYVPDSQFLRTLADDLDQAIHGPHVGSDPTIPVAAADRLSPDEARKAALDIVRRAYEAVRFLNVTVMNGNRFAGRDPRDIDTMPAEEAFGTDRDVRPVMPPRTVETNMILALHQQVYAALSSGTAPWFLRLLRQPEEVGDFTDFGRRKMPALMCGADGGYLALTRRQLDTIKLAAEGPPPSFAPAAPTVLSPRNLTAQMRHAAFGNPIISRPEMAIANCCPGLETDFRAVWRCLLEGIVLSEHDNYVIDAERNFEDLKDRRVVAIDGQSVITELAAPTAASINLRVPLTAQSNPHATMCMEWSNTLANILHEKQGQMVTCEFSARGTKKNPVPRAPYDKTKKYKQFALKVRRFFDEETAVISEALAGPGELTQGLCSPWQNDLRECSCYYWASSRPDYVNVQVAENGLSQGINWLQRDRSPDYVPDDYGTDLYTYDELFEHWEEYLQFQVGGKDSE